MKERKEDTCVCFCASFSHEIFSTCDDRKEKNESQLSVSACAMHIGPLLSVVSALEFNL